MSESRWVCEAKRINNRSVDSCEETFDSKSKLYDHIEKEHSVKELVYGCLGVVKVSEDVKDEVFDYGECLICSSEVETEDFSSAYVCDADDRDDPFVYFAGYPVGHRSEFSRIMKKMIG